VNDADRHYAAGLATALLAGAWERAELRRSCARAVGRQRVPAWIGALIDQVLERVEASPRDAPRALAELLPTLPAWARGRVARTRWPIVTWRPEPGVMGQRRWPVRVLDDVSDLARLLDVTIDELAWFADVRSLERTSGSPLRHYRVEVRRKAGGDVRVLEAPKPRLREMQRRLLRHVLGPVPVHSAAHGCVPGRSVRTALAPHSGRGTVVRCDLSAFFASIAAGRVWGVLRMTGLPEPVAHTITGLCTTVLGVGEWRAIDVPTDADVAARHRRLGRTLATPHLPQGAPTSPALANLVAFNLDRRLSGLASALGLAYTRYVDDLIFSGPDVRAAKLLRAVERIVLDEGFTVARHKNVVLSASGRQQVLGGVVNVTTTVPRREVDRLRAILHNCAVHGWETQARGVDREQFRQRLQGRVAWVNALDPRRGNRLRAMLDEIDWTPVHPVA
jgi:RNA-directed DNA polymerase